MTLGTLSVFEVEGAASRLGDPALANPAPPKRQTPPKRFVQASYAAASYDGGVVSDGERARRRLSL